MQILSLPRKTSVSVCPTGGVWVLGFFDGVHSGHRKLLSAASHIAGSIQNRNGISCPVGVWSFCSLPKASELLTSPEERASLFSDCGVQWLVLEEFAAVSHLSGKSFFSEYLMATLQPAALVCGFNFRFGYKGESCAEDLVQWGKEAGIPVEIVSPYETDGRVVSSTWIRSLIREGEVETAAELLTQPYCICGTVEHGKALGRKLGFPTANIRLPACKVVPANGIYACLVRVDGQERMGVCNIGFRPTVNENPSDITAETWIPDYNGNLYGKNIEIALYKRLRGEMKFPNLEALSHQIRQDALDAAKFLQTGKYRHSAAEEME